MKVQVGTAKTAGTKLGWKLGRRMITLHPYTYHLEGA